MVTDTFRCDTACSCPVYTQSKTHTALFWFASYQFVPQQHSKCFAPFPNYKDLALGMIPDCRQWLFANVTAHLFRTWNPETHQEGSTLGGIHNVVGGMACTSFYETAILRLHSSHSSIYCTTEGLFALAEIWCNSFHNHQKRLEIGGFNSCTRFSNVFVIWHHSNSFCRATY